jgi:hypothetical protein
LDGAFELSSEVDIDVEVLRFLGVAETIRAIG